MPYLKPFSLLSVPVWCVLQREYFRTIRKCVTVDMSLTYANWARCDAIFPRVSHASLRYVPSVNCNARPSRWSKFWLNHAKIANFKRGSCEIDYCWLCERTFMALPICVWDWRVIVSCEWGDRFCRNRVYFWPT